jgi:hypothetical protein
MLSFTPEEYDDLEHPAQQEEERCMITIGFEFPRRLKNLATMFQAAVRQSAMTNPIDGPAQPSIETPSMTIRSSGLALSEI